MKKSRKISNIVLLGILIAGCIAGTIVMHLEYQKYHTKINDTEFIDTAMTSIEDAYELIQQNNLYHTLRTVCMIGGIVFAAGLLVYLLVCTIKDKRKAKNDAVSDAPASVPVMADAEMAAANIPAAQAVPAAPQVYQSNESVPLQPQENEIKNDVIS